ncbi:MAG TPA: hypothetical protein VHT91_18090 [Kofleriaceae bacterium]|nr:hypothetical protein [Kofleriaceae bacterium]
MDDTRAHGPSARNWLDLELDAKVLSGVHDDSVFALTEQLSLGAPTFRDRDVHDILRLFEPYQLRIRSATFRGPDGWDQGPLTVGMQRYFPIDHVAFLPLAYAHFGVETVVSTPWLSGRHVIPPTAVRIVDAVDTELAQNGWSLRPVSGYVRADFLACRSFFGELGAAPELFVPASGPDEYDARFHVAFGWSFGCVDRIVPRRPKLSVEYRGRVRLHADDLPIRYRDSLGVGLQVDFGPLVVQILASTDLVEQPLSYGMLGVRLQLGPAKDPPP